MLTPQLISVSFLTAPPAPRWVTALMLVAALALPGHAAAYACTGKVDRVSVSPAGTVNASFTFQTGGMAWQDLCNLTAESGGVSVSGCKGVLAVLMTARQTQQDVMMWFDNSTGSCTAVPWKPLKDMGWYWGPSL